MLARKCAPSAIALATAYPVLVCLTLALAPEGEEDMPDELMGLMDAVTTEWSTLFAVHTVGAS